MILFLDEQVLNDHIALRTYQNPHIGIEHMAAVFKDFGYREIQDYHFKEKKLYAKHYEHIDNSRPKIFISELLVDKMSAPTQKIIHQIIEQIPAQRLLQLDFSCSGRYWDLSYKDYETLAAESEYAAWIASIGFRPNHFTISVNAMRKYNSIEKINAFIESQGYMLNTAGGKIKGTPSEKLEQSSTMAEKVLASFTEGGKWVPGCYYEFARRYPLENGLLYHGFIAASADKIFESTNRP